MKLGWQVVENESEISLAVGTREHDRASRRCQRYSREPSRAIKVTVTATIRVILISPLFIPGPSGGQVLLRVRSPSLVS